MVACLNSDRAARPLVAARLVGGRVAKPVTHSSTETNTPTTASEERPQTQSERFSVDTNEKFSVGIDIGSFLSARSRPWPPARETAFRLGERYRGPT